MVTSQWLLRRVAESEQQIYMSIAFGEERFKMLGYVAKQRAQLERSFRPEAVRRRDALGGRGASAGTEAVPREGLVGAQAGRALFRAGAEHEVAGSAAAWRALSLPLPPAPELLYESDI